MSRALVLSLIVSSLAQAAAPEVLTEPRQVLLGETRAVNVRVRGIPSQAKLRWEVSAGELSESGASGKERRFTWTPPDTRIPAVALLLFWVEEDDGAPDVGVARLPLIGRTDLEVSTEPDADVTIEVAKKTFGPVRADSSGRAVVPIEVPPGAFDARVLGKRDGKTTEVSVPLGVPPYNPLLAIIGPDPLYSEGTGWLWVFDASDFFTDKLSVALRGGDARLLETTKRGTLFELTPAPRSRRLSVTATAKGTDAKAEVSVKLTPGKPPEAAPVLPSKPESSVKLPTPSLLPAVFLGGFFGGGANLGFAGGVSAALHVAGPFSVEGELGFRRSSLTTPLPGLGELSSAITSIPVELSVRARALSAGPWAVDFRAGGGALPFIHSTSSEFMASATETGLGYEAFGAAELSHDLRSVEFFVELRGAYSPVSTPQLNAHLGGVMMSLGVRRSAL